MNVFTSPWKHSIPIDSQTDPQKMKLLVKYKKKFIRTLFLICSTKGNFSARKRIYERLPVLGALSDGQHSLFFYFPVPKGLIARLCDISCLCDRYSGCRCCAGCDGVCRCYRRNLGNSLFCQCVLNHPAPWAAENQWKFECRYLRVRPVSDSPSNEGTEHIGFWCSQKHPLQQSCPVRYRCFADWAEQIKVYFYEFPIGAGDIIVYENIGNNGDSAGASIM